MIASPISASNGDQGAFVEWQGRIVDQLFGQASVRYDHNDAFGDAVTWHVGPTYTIPGWGTQLKASAGTGFKAPTLNQLYVSLPAFGFFANPESVAGAQLSATTPASSSRSGTTACASAPPISTTISATSSTITTRSRR